MIQDSEIERWFSELRIPEAGRALIRRVRRGEAARQIQRQYDTVRTRFVSRKMGGRALIAESRTVEFPALYLHERDPEVQEYWPQPCTVDLFVDGMKGGRTRIPHTPDILLIKNDGFVVEEWREELRLLRLAADRPHHFSKDENGKWHYRPAEEHFTAIGITYRLRSADELPRIYIANLHFLEDYSREEVPAVPKAEVERLQTLLTEHGSLAHLDLVRDHQFSADHIFQMVLAGIGYVDLHAQRLDKVEELIIFRDEVVARADSLLKSEVPKRLPACAMAIKSGARFDFDGRILEVILCGTTSVTVCDEAGDTKVLPISLLQQLFKHSAIAAQGLTNTPDPPFDPGKVIADSKRLDRAMARLAALQDPENSGASKRSLRRWRAQIAGLSSPQDALPLLMGEPPGNRTPRLPAEVIALAQQAVDEHHNRATRPPVSATYAKHVALCAAKGVPAMSKSSFYEWIKSRENVRKREGRRAAYQKDPIPLTFDYEHPVHGVLPHEVLYIDHTTVNEFVRGQYIGNLGKPTLSIAVDGAVAKTRAMYLSFDAPSADSVLMLLRDYVRRHGRLPRVIVLDNGPEFHSKALLRLCKFLQIDIRWRRRSKPRDSAVVERMLGATEEEVIASHEGNTRALKNPREVSREVHPEGFIRWTLTALHGAIEHYLFQLHPNRVHPRFGICPNDLEKRMVLERGARSFVMVRYDAIFRLLTSPHAGIPTRKIDRRRGVFVDGVYYWNDRLARAREGEKAEVRREMWCARVVYVSFRGQWIIAQARDGGRLEGRFLHELEIARRKENTEKRKVAQRDRYTPRISTEKTLLWIPEVWDSRLREQAMEAYYLYELLGMTEALPEAKNARSGLFDLGTPLAPSAQLLEGVSAAEPGPEAEPKGADPGDRSTTPLQDDGASLDDDEITFF